MFTNCCGHSQKFCLCLPVRLGVILLSIFDLITSTLVDGTLWAAMFQLDVFSQPTAKLTNSQRVTTFLLAISLAIRALCSLFGLIGAIFKKRSLVEVYSVLLNWNLAFYTAIAIFWVVATVAESRLKLIDRCINGSTNQTRIDACQHTSVYRFVAIAFIALNWLIALYCAVVVLRYVRQLYDEEDQQHRLSRIKSFQTGYTRRSGSLESLTKGGYYEV